MKNEGVLPLDKSKKTAFIGAFAEAPRYQGAGSSHINVAHPVSALESAEGIPVVYEKGYDPEKEDGHEAEKLLQESVAAAKAAEAAVIFAGLPESYETEGCDREDIRMPENQNRLISEIAKVQEHTIVVLHGGSPIALPWLDEVQAVLCMHLGGDQAGKAAVELLYGDAEPSGRLAETWPLRTEDNPSYLNFPGENGIVEYREGIYIGYRYYDKKAMEVQFPFGYGLSYTTFEYRDMKLDKESMTDKDKLKISLTVKNTGSRFGKEVVQIYTRVKDSAVRRPVRELKGFEKIALQPGEEKTVQFVLDAKAFAYYEPRISDWLVEKKEVIVEAGASSRDIRLSASLFLDSGMEPPIEVTRYTTIGELIEHKSGHPFVQGVLRKTGGQSEGTELDEQRKKADSAMGAGGEKMRRQMMLEMPLNTLVAFGTMDDAALDQIVADLNAK